MSDQKDDKKLTQEAKEPHKSTIKEKLSNSNKEGESLANDKINKLMKNKLLLGLSIIGVIGLIFLAGWYLGSKENSDITDDSFDIEFKSGDPSTVDYSEADEVVVRYEEAAIRRDERQQYKLIHLESCHRLDLWDPNKGPDPDKAHRILNDYTLIRYPKDENTAYYEIEYTLVDNGTDFHEVHKVVRTAEGWRIVCLPNKNELYFERKRIEPQVVRWASH
jgi:hypothetical protein